LVFSSLYRGYHGVDRYWFIAIGLGSTFMRANVRAIWY
jgi:hypothetical protein